MDLWSLLETLTTFDFDLTVTLTLMALQVIVFRIPRLSSITEEDTET